MPEQTQKQKAEQFGRALNQEGGSFYYHIAHAFLLADLVNLKALREAFPNVGEMFEAYRSGVLG